MKSVLYPVRRLNLCRKTQHYAIHTYTHNLTLLTLYQPLLYTNRVILSVLDSRKCECLKDYSLDFEHAYMTTYLAS